MSKLLDLYVEHLPISPFLDTLIAGLKDHNYNKIACCHILRKAVQFAPIEIVEKMSQITPSVIEILTMQVKESWVKQEADRLEEVKMNVLDLVVEISTISDMKSSQTYIDLMKLIQSDNSLRQLWLKANEQNTPTGTK